MIRILLYISSENSKLLITLLMLMMMMMLMLNKIFLAFSFSPRPQLLLAWLSLSLLFSLTRLIIEEANPKKKLGCSSPLTLLFSQWQKRRQAEGQPARIWNETPSSFPYYIKYTLPTSSSHSMSIITSHHITSQDLVFLYTWTEREKT